MELPVMHKTHCRYFKNVGYTAFPHFALEKFTVTVSTKNRSQLVMLFHKNIDCAQVALHKVPDTQGYEKRHCSDDYRGSGENDPNNWFL